MCLSVASVDNELGDYEGYLCVHIQVWTRDASCPAINHCFFLSKELINHRKLVRMGNNESCLNKRDRWFVVAATISNVNIQRANARRRRRYCLFSLPRAVPCSQMPLQSLIWCSAGSLSLSPIVHLGLFEVKKDVFWISVKSPTDLVASCNRK